MRIDFNSLAFDYTVSSGGNTPSWGTALGQGIGYKIKDGQTFDKLTKGMIYKAVAPSTISFTKGRGGREYRGDDPDASLVIAAVFDKVYVNDTLIDGGKFIMMILKDSEGTHIGRLQLKYGLENKYTQADGRIIKNRDFKNLAAQQLGLAENACWFVYNISIENQDELRLRAIIVNENGPEVYEDSKALHDAWEGLISDDLKEGAIPDYLSIEQLAEKLEEMYNNPAPTGKSVAAMIFGFKYASIIDAYKYSSAKILAKTSIRPSYDVEIDKGVRLARAIKNGEYGLTLDLEYNNENSNITENIKFKNLLRWFIKQLDINNNLEEGDSIFGRGHKGEKIRDFYKDWREYGDFTLDCNLASGFQSIQSGANYINKTASGINIRPEFDKENKKVVSVYIDLHGESARLSGNVDDLRAVKYNVDLLDLFTDAEPNELLNQLFEKYKTFIIEDIENKCKVFNFNEINGNAINKIYFGIPGCGKSYHIAHKVLAGYEKENIIRTTFYQDYSNTDFVGQILPKISRDENGKDIVEYIFNPGPFTLALIQAISNPTKKVALVVEEINRGNAPAIFGDIFQLLDRDENSVSEYGIVNVSIIDYLNDYEFTVNGKKVKYHFDEIKIPGNLDILATMNTSDQNVYTLDTAFTRRWSKERIPNEFNGHAIKDMLVPRMNTCTWGKFVEVVNNHIKDNLESLQVNEDKQVGAFFVKERDLLAKEEGPTDAKVKAFAYKVLEYLWDDVSKLDHSIIFNPSYKTFEGLVDGFVKHGAAIFNDKLGFKKEVQVVEETN